MIKLATLLAPMISQLRECLLAYDIVQMDETRIQVLKEAGRSAQSDSYIWVQRGGPPHQPIVLFHYAPSRGRSVAAELLAGFAGYVQSDGYEVYTALAAARADIRLIGCFAHARRKFDEVLEGQGKKGNTGKALAYLRNQWPKLVGYLDDARLAIDNNACERVIRPFVIGRRNWLFADTPNGAGASATLYSIMETAKANGQEPYRYLRHVLTELPKASSPEQVARLLPFNIAPDDIPDPSLTCGVGG